MEGRQSGGQGTSSSNRGHWGEGSGAPFRLASKPLGLWETTQFVAEIMAIIGIGKGECRVVQGILGGGL